MAPSWVAWVSFGVLLVGACTGFLYCYLVRKTISEWCNIHMWSCFGSSSQTYLQKKIVAANSEKHFNRLEKAIKHRDLTDETIAVYVNKCVAKWNETESLCPSQARILEYIRQKQGTHLFRSIVAAFEQFNGGAMRELLHTYIIWADILLEDDFERFCQRCRSFTLFIRQEQWAPSLVLQALIKTCESLARIKNEAKWNVCEVLAPDTS
jgi:hypothetical protein